ncbi:MAG: lycopene cyclase domain-containing protein [Chitinivibrionales bacterium]
MNNFARRIRIFYRRGLPTYIRGKRWPAWALIALPFVMLLVYLRRRVHSMCWRSAVTVVLLFEIANLFIEHRAVYLGHWVYNEARILGPRIWGIPIEEPMIYYLFPPLFVIIIMHLFYQWFRGSHTIGSHH